MITRSLDNALKRIISGVYVITTGAGDIINGMTAAWVTRVSFNPPMLCVAIGKTRYTHELIEKSGVFAVNILGENQIDLGKHFGFKSGRDFNKFQGIPYETEKTGSPILKDTAGYLDCEVRNSCDAGDHTIFVGKIVSAGVNPEIRPLIYRREDFF